MQYATPNRSLLLKTFPPDPEEGPATAPFFLMRIQCLKATAASGKHLVAGEPYEVSDKDGALLIRMGKAVEAAEESSTEAKPKRRRAPKNVEQ